MKQSFVAATVGTATLLNTGIALAEDAPPAPKADSGQVQQVVITASKRAKETLQEVPISISAFTSEQMEQRNIVNFMDYGTSVPNLGFGSTGNGALSSRSVSIRGVGGGRSTSTTGFYLDETPVPDSLDPHITDIERIEVLRGPQGTLYGARSMGGTVRLLTKQPDFKKFSGFAKGSLSHTQGAGSMNYEAEAGVNAPIIKDELVLRADVFYDHEGGFIKRAFPDPADPTQTKVVDDVAAKKTAGMSESLAWRLTPDFTATQKLMVQRASINGFPYADTTRPSGDKPVLEPTSLTQTRTRDVPEGGTDKWSLAALDLKYRTDLGEFVSSSSYFRKRNTETEDSTPLFVSLYKLFNGIFGSSASAPASPLARSLDTDRYVQELRFGSNLKGPFQFVSGIYLSKDETTLAFPPAFVPGLSTDFPLLGLPDDKQFEFAPWKVTTKEQALFGEASYQLTDALKLTGGLRAFRVDVDSGATFQEGFGVGGHIDFPEVKKSSHGINPKAQLQYKVSPDFMTYATAAKGFRPGGAQTGVPPTTTAATGNCQGAVLDPLGLTSEQTRQYESDSLWSYELGAKSTLLDRRLTVDAAIYQIDWKNIQQYINTACGFPYIANAGDATIRGAELEVHARPLRGLDIAGGVGYSDAKLTRVNTSSPQKVGDHVLQVPAWTGNVSATYGFLYTDDVFWETNVNYAYVGKSYSFNNGAYSTRPGYGLLNAQTSWSWGKHRIALFGKNLANKRANLGDSVAMAIEPIDGSLTRVVTNTPRTIGVSYSLAF